MIDITGLKGLENLCGKDDPRYSLNYICIKGSIAYACNGYTVATVEIPPREDDGLAPWFGIPVDIFKLAFKIAKKRGYVYVAANDGKYTLLAASSNDRPSQPLEFTPLLGDNGGLVDIDRTIPDEKVYTPVLTLAVKQLELIIKQAKTQGVGSLSISLNESDKRSTPVRLTALDDPRIKAYVMPVNN